MMLLLDCVSSRLGINGNKEKANISAGNVLVRTWSSAVIEEKLCSFLEFGSTFTAIIIKSELKHKQTDSVIKKRQTYYSFS